METIIVPSDDSRYLHCLAVRRKVFIEEQGVPEARERDGLDDVSRHYLFMHDGRPIGTARTRQDSLGGKSVIKIERFAFVPDARGLGLGAAAFRSVMDDCAAFYTPAPIKIGAQAYLRGFYERLGFAAEGAVFQDAGIDHVWMTYTGHLT